MKQVGELVGRIGDGTLTENTASISSTEQGAEEICPRCKGIGYLRADVPIEHPDFGKLVPCTCRLTELAQQRVESLRVVSELDTLSRMTFDTFIPDGRGLPADKQANLRWAYEEARLFAENPKGWLVLKGGYGCGKTHLAVAIANACVERGQPVLFRAVPDLLDHLRAAFAPSSPAGYDARFEEVRTAPVLILDDLGTESPTPWAQEKLFQIFNHRYNAHLPTVITTNRELEEIPMRLRSRLNDLDVTRIVTVLAPDYRGSGVAPDQSDLSTLSLHSDQTFESFDSRKGEGLPRGVEENLHRAFNGARSFAENLPHEWLIFTGTYGCGKTHLAAAIANYRAAQGQPVLFVVVPDLLDLLRATFNPQSTITFYQQFEEVRRAPLLILDDLGTESATPWAREKLYQIFDYRYNARLPTVITTAINIDDADPYLRTRMLDVSRSTVFEILAPAYRGGGPRGKPARRSKARR
jgi:DNA replication protein DnaC